MKILTGLVLLLCLSACNLSFPAASPSQNVISPSPMPPIPADIVMGDCFINIGQTMNVYDTPGNWGIIIGRLSEGDRVTVLESSSNGWYRVEGIMSGWVAGNAAFPEGNCGDLPRVEAQPPLTACQVTNNSGEVQTLYTSPQNHVEAYGGRFHMNETMSVIHKQGDWYMVYVAAFSTGMWIQASVVSASPECAALP